MSLTVLILAAGEGTRMKSAKSKVMHKVCGLPMILHVIDAASGSNPDRIVAILGANREVVSEILPDNVTVALQETPLGTGHAVLSARQVIAGSDNVLVLSGDSPLVTPETLAHLRHHHESAGAAATILTCFPPNPFGYGRVVRNAGRLDRIVEELDADAATKAIREVNTGTYMFKAPELLDCLDRLGNDNAKGEYYLTDCISELGRQGRVLDACTTDDPEEMMGINSRLQLAEAERVMRDRIRRHWMTEGVTMLDPASVFIDTACTFDRDVTLMPSTLILGKSHIGEGSLIGPFTFIDSAKIGKRTRVLASQILEAEIGDDVDIGPYTRIRPATIVSDGAKVGSFVELKKTTVGPGSKVPHLSYIGDTEIGTGVNIGAGTITCNYDGFEKHRTVIEDGAFIGSDTMLVAPVIIGSGAITGAGSTITGNVPPGALGISRPEQMNIEDYVEKRNDRKDKE